LCRYHLSPMRPSDRDIWTAANEVIKANDDPLLHVAMRYDALLEAGDMAGCRVWRRIGEAVEEMLKQQPDGAVH
jgi:hypothetical protein